MGHPIASNVRSMLHEGKTMIRCLPHCQLHTSWLRREPPPRVLGPTMRARGSDHVRDLAGARFDNDVLAHPNAC